MKRLILFLLLPLVILSQQLEIPDITVYGERQIIIEPVEKGTLPFEEEPIPPIYKKKRATLPSIKGERGIKNERNLGLQVRTEAGGKYEGYLIGYLRNYYYPLELGVSGLKNSNVEEDYFNLFLRTSLNNFYFNAGFLNKSKSEKIYSLAIYGYFPIFRGDINFTYHDSLMAKANLELSLMPFDLNLDVDDDFEYQFRASYYRYPLKAGLSFYEERIYPELLYFLPFGRSLYVKGSLLERNGISQSFAGLPQFQWEWNHFDPYYRIELGGVATFGVSVFYSAKTLTDTLSYLGISTNYKGFQLEIGYPLKDGYTYLRAGAGLRVLDIIDVNLYGYLYNEDHYFLSTDIGYLLTRRIKIGASGTIIKGWKDDFDLTGYLSFYL